MLTLTLSLALPALSSAAIIGFDFTTLGANNTELASSVSHNGVIATGFSRAAAPGTTGTGNFTATPLWLRNQPGDHGLGVCSEGSEACSTEGGDTNEISQLETMEALLLTLPVDARWDGLFVSSLDPNGTIGTLETGRVYWGNDVTFIGNEANLDALLGGPNHFGFDGDDFASDSDPSSAVEGDLFGLGLGGQLDQFARYILFVPDGVAGANNDYLVWKGVIFEPDESEVPEPSAAGLLGVALAVAARRLRRRRDLQ